MMTALSPENTLPAKELQNRGIEETQPKKPNTR
jgi:hypothetical protein